MGREVDQLEGTTLATGLVGHWYIRYGTFGVIEGALIFGFLLSTVEAMFRNSRLKPLTVFLACGMLMTLFRLFRAFGYSEIYGMIIGVFALWIILQFLSVLTGGSSKDYSAAGARPM
jgi:hypothetical protein